MLRASRGQRSSQVWDLHVGLTLNAKNNFKHNQPLAHCKYTTHHFKCYAITSSSLQILLAFAHYPHSRLILKLFRIGLAYCLHGHYSNGILMWHSMCIFAVMGISTGDKVFNLILLYNPWKHSHRHATSCTPTRLQMTMVVPFKCIKQKDIAQIV